MEKFKLKVTDIVAQSEVNEATALQVKNSFDTFIQQIDEWKEKSFALVVTDVHQTDIMEEAKKTRLELRAIRTGADKKRKELKEDSLKYGRAIQAVYNFIESEIKPIEAHLEAQEKFLTNKLIEQAKQREADRKPDVEKYAEHIPNGIDVYELPDKAWGEILDWAKEKFNKAEEVARIEAEKVEKERAAALAEKHRIEAEKAMAEIEAMEALKAERAEQEKQLKAEREKQAALQAKLVEETKERERLEAEKKKLEAEKAAKEKAEVKEAARLAAAPDNEKLLAFAAMLEKLPRPELETEPGREILFDANELLLSIVDQIRLGVKINS